MKTYHSYNLKIIGVLFLNLFSGSNMFWSQSLIKSSAPVNPYYISSFSESNGNLLIGNGSIGIGVSPIAKLHVRSTGNDFLFTPVLKTEFITTGGTLLGSIQTLLKVGTQNYGIYENSPGGLLNYFKDPLKIDNIQIYNDANIGPTIRTDQYVNYINFVMSGNAGVTKFPLTINCGGVRVQGKLVTDEFQLLTNSGANKILASDANGNGTWIDPSPYLNDYWKPNGSGDIYTDYRRVGIGTSKPSRSLEICHTDETGGIVLNQIATDPSINTTEVRFERSGDEKFAIGYRHRLDGCPSFFIWNNNPLYYKTALFIDANNNNTGIDTEFPSAKLDVNGDLKAQRIGIGINPPLSTDSYKLFVDGGIAAREVKVTINTFPDYVFSDTYKLLSLDNLGKYITNNKHLPGIPSSNEVEKDNGVELGAMQVKLVEKIEEQTLYILDLQKQLNELKKQVESLTKK